MTCNEINCTKCTLKLQNNVTLPTCMHGAQ